jgi:hypothetical protein
LPDEPLVAIGVTTVWVHWQKDVHGDGRPIEHRVTAAGQIHPDREDLGDLDAKAWSLGLDGKPADPWKDTRYLYLVNPRTGADYTFVTDSYGGRKGVGNLKTKIMNVRMAHAGAVPVIKASFAPFKTQYGMRKRPEFEVLNWRNAGSGQTVNVPNGPQPKRLEQFNKAAIDDEIPFS